MARQTILKKLRNTYGARNLPWGAVRFLRSSRDIRSFWKQYMGYLATRGDILDPEDRAERDIRSVLGNFSDTAKARWQRALPEVFE